jgi:hypothetical protein
MLRKTQPPDRNCVIFRRAYLVNTTFAQKWWRLR